MIIIFFIVYKVSILRFVAIIKFYTFCLLCFRYFVILFYTFCLNSFLLWLSIKMETQNSHIFAGLVILCFKKYLFFSKETSFLSSFFFWPIRTLFLWPKSFTLHTLFYLNNCNCLSLFELCNNLFSLEIFISIWSIKPLFISLINEIPFFSLWSMKSPFLSFTNENTFSVLTELSLSDKWNILFEQWDIFFSLNNENFLSMTKKNPFSLCDQCNLLFFLNNGNYHSLFDQWKLCYSLWPMRTTFLSVHNISQFTCTLIYWYIQITDILLNFKTQFSMKYIFYIEI